MKRGQSRCRGFAEEWDKEGGIFLWFAATRMICWREGPHRGYTVATVTTDCSRCRWRWRKQTIDRFLFSSDEAKLSGTPFYLASGSGHNPSTGRIRRCRVVSRCKRSIHNSPTCSSPSLRCYCQNKAAEHEQHDHSNSLSLTYCKRLVGIICVRATCMCHKLWSIFIHRLSSSILWSTGFLAFEVSALFRPQITMATFLPSLPTSHTNYETGCIVTIH